MYLALDTNIIVAATVGQPDLFWSAWVNFDRVAIRKRFVPRAAMEEFSEIVEGVGSRRTGILEQLLSDAITAIRSFGPRQPGRADLESIGIVGNQAAKVVRLFDSIKEACGNRWDSGDARELLRRYELDFALRKAEFFNAHPIYEPSDASATAVMAAGLEAIGSSRGQSWKRDCGILAQVGMIGRERQLSIEFVTEDRHHIWRLSRQILALTPLARIRDMAGASPP